MEGLGLMAISPYLFTIGSNIKMTHLLRNLDTRLIGTAWYADASTWW